MKNILMTTAAMALMCGTAMAADDMNSSGMNNGSMMNNSATTGSTMSAPTGQTATMDRTATTGSMSSAAMGNSGIVTAQNIKSLPDSGQMVRIMGTVKDVKGSDKFTLSDGSTTVKVMTKGSTAQIATGDKVTVIGKVDSGMMGKSIENAEVKKGMDTSSLPYEVAANSYSQGGTGMMGSSSAGYEGGTVSNGAMMSTTRTGEAMDNPNMENDNSQMVKPYTKNMSMNDYNAKNKTSRMGQVNIQPENGMGSDSSMTR